MIFKIKKSTDISENQVTDKESYNKYKMMGRRNALKDGVKLTLSLGLMHNLNAEVKINGYPFKQDAKYPLSKILPPVLTPSSKATSYNNYYEFGMSKSDPIKHSSGFFQQSPWDIKIDGLVQKPSTISLEDIFKKIELIERIYHFRCVEAWSMNIPYIGFRLKDILSLVKPLSNAKYIRFETMVDKNMPSIKNPYLTGGINFPYIETLRIDEANNDLTLLSVGMYGEKLLPQNGAPLRLVVPWKYGFKSIKSIVRITFTESMPKSTWMQLASNEYGFYANVNPEVAHPRWSQANETFIGDSFLNKSQKTLLFNGYANEVAHMYKDLDLKHNF